MGILLMLIPIAVVLSLAGVLAYIWAFRNRQFEDMNTPAHRILFDDEVNERKDAS